MRDITFGTLSSYGAIHPYTNSPGRTCTTWRDSELRSLIRAWREMVFGVETSDTMAEANFLLLMPHSFRSTSNITSRGVSTWQFLFADYLFAKVYHNANILIPLSSGKLCMTCIGNHKRVWQKEKIGRAP